MNDLRQNIKSFTPLDVTKQDNPILKALAAFILKEKTLMLLCNFVKTIHTLTTVTHLHCGGYNRIRKIPKPIVASIANLPSFGEHYRAICTLLYNTDVKGEWPFMQQPVEIKSMVLQSL